MNLQRLIILVFILLMTVPGTVGQGRDSIAVRDSLDKLPVFRYRFEKSGIMLGYHQFSSGFIEIGYSKISGVTSRCAFGSGYSGYAASLEYNPFRNGAGISASCFAGGGTLYVIGLNAFSLITLDHEHRNLTGIRPSIGLGFEQLNLSYAYNFFIYKGAPELLNHHNAVLRVFIPFREKRIPLK